MSENDFYVFLSRYHWTYSTALKADVMFICILFSLIVFAVSFLQKVSR